MRIFVYEHLTGGGTLAAPHEPIAPSLLTEGYAMLSALATDFAALPNVEVVTLVDHRLSGLPWPGEGRSIVERTVVETDAHGWSCFVKSVLSTDWTVVIAPEIDDALHRRCRVVEGLGKRLLGPSGELVQLAADKVATCGHLADAGLPVPEGVLWQGGSDWPTGLAYPVVLKPRTGAGSWQIERLRHAPAKSAVPTSGEWRIERFYPGQAASVAALCGPAGSIILPPCTQRLSDDDRFTYLGGNFTLTPNQVSRARRWMQRVLATLPAPKGYLGIDLVLGNDPGGSDDRIIEINPRLTTSYLGLRAACRDNLAAAMWQCVEGQPPGLTWHDRAVAFDTSGVVR